MMKFLAACVALILAFASADANAQHVSANDITRILTERGYEVSDYGSNMVAVNAGGVYVLVGVDGPDGDVSYITYLSGVTADQLGYDLLNQFNNEVKFGRAYVDADGDIAIQMDRNAAGGVSDQNIASDFDVFLLLIRKFMNVVATAAVV